MAEMRFSLFQNLKELAIKFSGKFRLTDESFKSDLPTETLLHLRIDVDGMLPSSIESNALSYAYRPINVYLVHPENIGKQQCKLLTLEEEIYAPFLAVNPENKIHINECPILCDCSIKWLFDAPKDWWMRVEAGDNNIGLQCDDSRSLYFYSDYDFRSCPKTNLLKYFIPDPAVSSSDKPPASSADTLIIPESDNPISTSYASSDTISIGQEKPDLKLVIPELVISDDKVQVGKQETVSETKITENLDLPKESLLKEFSANNSTNSGENLKQVEELLKNQSEELNSHDDNSKLKPELENETSL